MLVFGGFGGTVAAADTETDGAVSDAHGLPGGDHEVESIHTQPSGTIFAPVIIHTVPSFVGTFGTGTFSESEDEETARGTGEGSSVLTGPMSFGSTTGSETGTDAAVTVADDDKGSDSVPADATQEVNEPKTVGSHAPTTEPSPDPEVTAVNADPPAGEPSAEEPPAVQSVTTDVAVVDTSSAQAEAAPFAVGPAAVGNLVAVLAYLFTPAPDGTAPILSLTSSLLSLLDFPLTGEAQTAPVAAGGIGGSLFAGGMSTPEHAVLASAVSGQENWPEMLIASGGSPTWSAPGAGLHEAFEGISATGVEEEHLSVALADSIVPEQVRSVLRYTVGAVLAPLSLLVLALTASPGIAGLVLLGAAGTFVGYRQAKAASVLRAVGIARFVKAGPLGVVRSGGLVAVHSRTSRADRGQSRRPAAKLESVA